MVTEHCSQCFDPTGGRFQVLSHIHHTINVSPSISPYAWPYVHVVMRIQCSDATYQLLRKRGGFTMECRGGVNVKVSPMVMRPNMTWMHVHPSLMDAGKGDDDDVVAHRTRWASRIAWRHCSVIGLSLLASQALKQPDNVIVRAQQQAHPVVQELTTQ